MTVKNKRALGIHQLYDNDPIKADEIIWGRFSDSVSRRGFLKRTGLTTMAFALGNGIPFAEFMPAGLIPAAFANTDTEFRILGKEELIILNDRPLNAETPAHLLDDDVTPAKYLFVRNNGIPPDVSEINPENWTLNIAGESCQTPRTFTIAELKQTFRHYTFQIQLECGGNGRSEFFPPAKGNQWSTGAIGCPRWTGARLKDVLNVCGIKDNAVYTAFYGADRHLSGDPNKPAISRGVPISKAMENESLIAWAMNDEDMPIHNGHPLRLITGGWPGSTSGKWLKTILIRDRIHDGPKMTGKAYRIPCESVAPGSEVPDEKMCIIESMPVKSLVTYPKSGITQKLNKNLTVRGHSWAGDNVVKAMYTSIDFGITWQRAKLNNPVNRLAWQHWHTTIEFPQNGYYEIWARAVDDQGYSQPMLLPGWNPKGYFNNACHRIAVQVT